MELQRKKPLWVEQSFEWILKTEKPSRYISTANSKFPDHTREQRTLHTERIQAKDQTHFCCNFKALNCKTCCNGISSAVTQRKATLKSTNLLRNMSNNKDFDTNFKACLKQASDSTTGCLNPVVIRCGTDWDLDTGQHKARMFLCVYEA